MLMTYVIKEDNAPERLKGLEIIAKLTVGKIEFTVNIPDANAQEEGYIRWFIGEIVDKLEKEIPDLGIEQTTWEKV